MNVVVGESVGDLPAGGVRIGSGTIWANPYTVGQPPGNPALLERYCAWIEGRIMERDPVIVTGLAGLHEGVNLVYEGPPQMNHGPCLVKVWEKFRSMGGIRGLIRPLYHEDGSLPSGEEIFVFGSNLRGIHDAGAARVARDLFGAERGVASGLTGRSYALPTKDGGLKTLPLREIQRHVAELLSYADSHPDQHFFVTRVGCGLAGYEDDDIAPMFMSSNWHQFSFASSWSRLLTPRRMVYAGIGSRSTPEWVCRRMTRIAARLRDYGYILRSGGAAGADESFERGAGLQKEIFLPWPGFRESVSLNREPSADAMRIGELLHPNWRGLKSGARLLMARNSHQILGEDLRSPVDFVVCWTPDGCEGEASRTVRTGGTGQAIALADRWGIPVFNLARPDALDRLREHLGE